MQRPLQVSTRLVVAMTPTSSSSSLHSFESFTHGSANGTRHHYGTSSSYLSTATGLGPRSNNLTVRLPKALSEPTVALALHPSDDAWMDLPFSMIQSVLATTMQSLGSSTALVSSSSGKTAGTRAQSSSKNPPPSSNDVPTEDTNSLIIQNSPPLWAIPLLITACDLFKAGIPMKLLYHVSMDFTRLRVDDQRLPQRRRRRSWWWLPFAKQSSSLVKSKQDEPTSGQGPVGKQAMTIAAYADTNSMSTTSLALQVGGIPNYGQTCFLNAVLQALASLEPFLVYLERIVQVRQQQQLQQQQATHNASTSAATETIITNDFEDTLSNHVWKVLLTINGCSSQQQRGRGASKTIKDNGKVDPRRILRRIGETNAQFQCYAQKNSNRFFNEQQDAQELLQALLGVVIQDAHLDTTSSSLESSFACCGAPPPLSSSLSPSPVFQSTQKDANATSYMDDQEKHQQRRPPHGLVGNYFYHPHYPDDETLTTVMATEATTGTLSSPDPSSSSGVVDWSPTSSTIMDSKPNSPTITAETHGISMISSSSSRGGGSVLSLSTLLRQIDANQRNIQQQKDRQPESEGVPVSVTTQNGTLPPMANNPKGAPTNAASSAVLTTQLSTQPGSPDDPRHQREEKKKEEFEFSLPFATSEDKLEARHKDGTAINGSQCDENGKERTDDSTLSVGTLSTTTAAEMKELDHLPYEQQPMHRPTTTSMQIMRSTMSSITPSPLSGWLGSTLRCCNCKHVRPIQNAPFLDIPVIPTSIPRYLAGVAGRGSGGNHSGGKAPPASSRFPACTLEQCLVDFTSVERVKDVECRNCTIQKRLEELEDEAMLLQGAINSIVNKKSRQKQGGGDHKDDQSKNDQDYPEAQALQDDLAKIETRLFTLKTLDPDGDEVDSALLADVETEDTELKLLLAESMKGPTEVDGKKNPSSSSLLVRCEAKKCLLLTRCPSILCCHIQRRYFDPSTNRMEKCVQFVEFPLVLDLAPYCAYGPRSSTTWAAGIRGKRDPQHEDIEGQSTNGGGTNAHNKEEKAGRMTYRLQSIIEHRGNAHGGHYICYRRDHAGEWFSISDSNVTRISWQQVRSCQAYMLFYEAL
jgi:Ubiquitin carboxyl-terminal hydrolase